MLTVVGHKSGTVAIDVHFILNMPFAIKKRNSVSDLSSKINKQITLTISDADQTKPS
jgi:hypothetical protein